MTTVPDRAADRSQRSPQRYATTISHAITHATRGAHDERYGLDVFDGKEAFADRCGAMFDEALEEAGAGVEPLVHSNRAPAM